MEWSNLIIIVQLIFLEGVLSLDNAAVLGAMAAPLPGELAIPWPPTLRWLEDPMHRLLGMQREAALKVGLLGAYVGRFLMLLAAAFIVRNPWLRTVGAVYLVYLAVNHIAHMDGGAHHKVEHIDSHDRSPVADRQVGFWPTVVAIELADLAFSLDNVVAAITLSDKVWVLMLGVALGILAMRFAATLFTRLIQWEPALQTGAYLLVLSLGVELLLKETVHLHLGEMAQFAISLTILVLSVLVARSSLGNSAHLWRPIIRLFKLLYLPFGLVGWLLQGLAGPFRRHAANA
jgi:tellurite resistance protein TerC